MQTDSIWINKAVFLETYNSKSELLRLAVNDIYLEIEDVMKAQKQRMVRKTYRYALKTLIINLYYNKLYDRPTMYSRSNTSNPNKYLSKAVLKKVADVMILLGYANQKIGWIDRETNISRLTRVWCTTKLIDKLKSYIKPEKFIDDLYLENLREPIELRHHSFIQVV